MGVQIEIFKFSNLGLLEHFGSGVAYGGSNPARLGELGGNLVPPFPINRRREAVPNIPNGGGNWPGRPTGAYDLAYIKPGLN